MLVVALPPLASATQVPLVQTGGVYAVPVQINKATTLDFIVDSGAAEVNVPADVVSTLIRANTISIEDFLPGRTFVLADGTRVRSPRFTIRTVRIGDHVVENVPATIGEVAGKPLLGQSVLERLGRWSLDAGNGVMVFSEAGSAAQVPVPTSGSSTPTAPSCDDWRAAPPTCAVGFVRQYYENLSSGNCWGAGAQWAVRGEQRRAQCAKASSTFKVHNVVLTRTDPSGVSVAIQADELAKPAGRLRTSWAVGVRLVPGNPWSIVDLKEGKLPSVAAAVRVAPAPAAECTDWRAAPPSCAVGFVRTYYEDLSRGDCAAAMAKWNDPAPTLEQSCRKASSTFQLSNLSLTRTGSDGTSVELRALELDKGSTDVKECWQLTVRLRRGAPWAISHIRPVNGAQCHGP